MSHYKPQKKPGQLSGLCNDFSLDLLCITLKHRTMRIKEKTMIFVYGEMILEAYTLDMLLKSMSDGAPRPISVLTDSEFIPQLELNRKVDKLIEDGLISHFGNDVIISSNGNIHLAKGGYTRQVKESKRGVFSFWISIIAIIMAGFSLLIGILD